MPWRVGGLLAVLVLALAWPRLDGPSWISAGGGIFSLRELEGHTVGWEYILPAVAVQGMLGSDPAPPITDTFNTDHYRALIPIYLAAIFSHWLGSAYWGFAAAELLVAWLAVWSMIPLARRLEAGRAAAGLAAVLFAASPVLIHQMGMHTLHVASSTSLVPALLASLLVVGDERAPLWRRAGGFGLILVVASLFYNYQWVVAPCLLAAGVVARRRRSWVAAVVLGTALYLALTAVFHALLAAVDLPVRPHLNDPVRMLSGRLPSLLSPSFLHQAPVVLGNVWQLLLKAYHPYVFALAVAGAFFASPGLRLMLLTGTALAITASLVYPVTWIAVNGYPFVYVCAALAIVRLPRAIVTWLRDRFRAGPAPASAVADLPALQPGALAPTLSVILLLLALWSTNGDLFGNYAYLASWWDFTYVPR